MEFHLLSFRIRSHEFTLLEVCRSHGQFEVSIGRYSRYRSDYSGEWRVLVWPLFQVCFFTYHGSILADIYLFGRLFPIRRKGRSWPDDLPF